MRGVWRRLSGVRWVGRRGGGCASFCLGEVSWETNLRSRKKVQRGSLGKAGGWIVAWAWLRTVFAEGEGGFDSAGSRSGGWC